MSKLDFIGGEHPRITRKLDFGDYDKSLKGNYLEVWVNWSREFNDRVSDARNGLNRTRLAVGKETDDSDKEQALQEALDELFAVTAEFWGCTPEEVQAIWDIDVELWAWATEQAAALRNTFRDSRKKVT